MLKSRVSGGATEPDLPLPDPLWTSPWTSSPELDVDLILIQFGPDFDLERGISMKRFLQKFEGKFSQQSPGWVLQGIFGWIFSGLFPLKKAGGKIHPKIHGNMQIGTIKCGSFTAKIHAARIRPWGFPGPSQVLGEGFGGAPGRRGGSCRDGPVAPRKVLMLKYQQQRNHYQTNSKNPSLHCNCQVPCLTKWLPT